MDSIQGMNFGMYNARYLQVSDREKAHSVKPNVFKETEDTANKQNLQNLTKDMLALSPEAQEFMRLLKKHGKDSDQVKKFLDDKKMKELIMSYKELRELVYEDEDEEEEEDPATGKRKKKQKGKPAVPNMITLQLSNKPRPGGKSIGWTDLRELIDTMIVHAPNDSIRKTLVLELEPLGERVIRMVKSFGTRIIILPRNQSLTQLKIKGMAVVAPGERTFDGRPWDIVRGIYCNDRRLMVMGEEIIGNPHHSTARHEFAHAFDHTFSETNHRRLPLSVQLWNQFMEQRGGLVSAYAGTNPQEYFAECVEAFFRPAARENLSEADPLMYQYLERLF